jgi:hypothetical protein
MCGRSGRRIGNYILTDQRHKYVVSGPLDAKVCQKCMGSVRPSGGAPRGNCNNPWGKKGKPT